MRERAPQKTNKVLTTVFLGCMQTIRQRRPDAGSILEMYAVSFTSISLRRVQIKLLDRFDIARFLSLKIPHFGERVSVDKIPGMARMSEETKRVHHIFRSNLDMRKPIARWLPRILKFNNKRIRMTTSIGFLTLFVHIPKDLYVAGRHS